MSDDVLDAMIRGLQPDKLAVLKARIDAHLAASGITEEKLLDVLDRIENDPIEAEFEVHKDLDVYSRIQSIITKLLDRSINRDEAVDTLVNTHNDIVEDDRMLACKEYPKMSGRDVKNILKLAVANGQKSVDIKAIRAAAKFHPNRGNWKTS